MQMPNSLLATLAVCLAGLQVVSGAQLGFALGVKQPNGACKVRVDYEADLDAIRQNTGSSMLRIFNADECDVLAQMLPVAKEKGFKVILGIWPDTEGQYYGGKGAIMSVASTYSEQIHAVTVGSEGLYRGTYTAEQLVARINDIRAAVPQLRYGTADTWNRYVDGTADPVIRVADIILSNGFPYWQGAPVAGGAAVNVLHDDTAQAFEHIRAVAAGRDIELWVGETGWPSEGTTYQGAKPGLKEAERFYHEGVCLSLGAGTNVFVFEAFDEPWKPDSIGDDGSAADETHWGVMNVDRTPKFPLHC